MGHPRQVKMDIVSHTYHTPEKRRNAIGEQVMILSLFLVMLSTRTGFGVEPAVRDQYGGTDYPPIMGAMLTLVVMLCWLSETWGTRCPPLCLHGWEAR